MITKYIEKNKDRYENEKKRERYFDNWRLIKRLIMYILASYFFEKDD
jgi:hypothetical protein